MMSTTDTERLMPIEYALLDLLPLEGEMMGFTPIALQVRSILRKEGFEQVNAGDVAGRLKSLELKGFTVSFPVQPVGRGLGWQATKKGKEVVTKRKGANGS
jgi:hypothetical protein